MSTLENAKANLVAFSLFLFCIMATERENRSQAEEKDDNPRIGLNLTF